MRRFISSVLVVVLGIGLLVVSSPAEAKKLRIGAHRALMGS